MRDATLAATQVVARNIAPLAGILLLGWSARNVLYLYFLDTLLAMAVVIAGIMRWQNPPVEDGGWAARANSEVGIVAGGLFAACAICIPLAFGLAFMLGFDLAIGATLADPAFQVALGWQALAALSSYLSLAAALRTHPPETLRLKRRFALVFLRWVFLLMIAQYVAVLAGVFGAVVFVAVYAALAIWSEIAPDHFLRVVPGVAREVDGPAAVPASASASGPAKRDKRRRRR